MKIKNKIGLVIMFIVLIMATNSNNSVEAKMTTTENYLISTFYRSSSKMGFAINTSNSIYRILKLNKNNDRSSLFYFTDDAEMFSTAKNYAIHCNLKTNLSDAWGDYQKYHNIDKNNSFLNTNKYNQLLWVVDNLYTQIGTDRGEDSSTINEFIDSLNEKYNAGINNYNSTTGEYDLLSQDDIDVVQQLAIWHFTSTWTKNDIGDPRQSDYGMANLLMTNKVFSGKYTQMVYEEKMKEKLIAMSKLYTCFIVNADPNYRSMNLSKLKNSENQLANFTTYDNTTVNTVRSNEDYSYVSGPYRLVDNNLGVEYDISDFNCNAELIDGNRTDITNEITILVRNQNGRYDKITDSDGNEITDNLKILDKLEKENQDFYLAISSNVNQLKKIDLTINVRYTAREVYYYSLNNPGGADAPILKIENMQEIQEYSASAILELTTEMDFSLRQFITAINGEELKDEEGKYIREPKIDLSYINKRINGNRVTTANYNQTKDTIKVSLGDVITYTIRVYNEGGVSGYVSEITDYLPPYLEYINDEENSSNGWVLQDASDLRVIKTKKLAMVSGDDTGNINQRLIKAFDGENLDYKDIKLKCKVVDPNAIDNLTNTLSDIENNMQVTQSQEETETNLENEENPYGTDDVESDGISLDTIIQYARDFFNSNKSNEQENIEEQEISEGNTENENINELNSNIQNEGENQETQVDANNEKADVVIITNIAEITDFEDEFGNRENLVDRDSQKENFKLPSDEELPIYKNQDLIKNETYVPGEQDDDDFEKLQLKNFDLSLRQFISRVNDTEVTSRLPKVDMSNLNNGASTTASYNHSKEAFKVEIGDTIIFTIRVYNEGEIDGYCEEIMEHIPDQLEFLKDNEINKKYEWEQLNNSKLIRTKYLSKTNDEKGSGESKRENRISASDGNSLNYKDIQIVLRVVRTEGIVKKITTFSEITDFTDENGNAIRDKDSIKGNFQEPENWQDYREDQIRSAYISGQEDDDDFEKLILGEFDLSLREFISKINDSDINSRIPQVDGTNLKNLSSTTANYNHSKDVVTVNAGDLLVFTIRVYNEGSIAGYASQIKDTIPKGLEFEPDNEINKNYGWQMYDQNGNQTNDGANAVVAITDYLSKTAGERRMEEDTTIQKNPSLISAFNELAEISNINPAFKEVRIALKVKNKEISEAIIENKVEIIKTDDENGNEVTDRDSKANEWNDGEDDQDTEQLNVRYFNLSLNATLGETIIISNGMIKTIKNDPQIDSSNVNVAIDKKNIATTNVKFRYKITIHNEGTIPGYVTEIKDYIPEGLEFDENENVLWKKSGEKIIVTDQTKDTIIEPGKSLETEVILNWAGMKQKLGSYENYVEISKVYNEFNTQDIDSTPDNGINDENDIGKTSITLQTKKNNITTFIIIGAGALLIIIIGIILIRKFVV